MKALLQSVGSSPCLIVALNRIVTGNDIISASTINHTICIHSKANSFSTPFISICSSKMVWAVLLSILGIYPFASWVKTLENCFSRIDALSSSANFIESLLFGLSNSGAIPLFDLRDLLVCIQNTFGLDLAFIAISRSTFCFSFLRSVHFITSFCKFVAKWKTW